MGTYLILSVRGTYSDLLLIQSHQDPNQTEQLISTRHETNKNRRSLARAKTSYGRHDLGSLHPINHATEQAITEVHAQFNTQGKTFP
jgi:hypothetical protein